jgi:hypothetical protein
MQAKSRRGHHKMSLVEIRTYLCDINAVTEDEFTRKIKKLGRRRGVVVSFDPVMARAATDGSITVIDLRR